MGTLEFLAGIFVFGVIIYYWIKPSRDFHNYMPPEGTHIDYNAQSLDRIQNHLTNEQVMRNTVNGKYNVKD